jgi:hypothetical protein
LIEKTKGPTKHIESEVTLENSLIENTISSPNNKSEKEKQEHVEDEIHYEAFKQNSISHEQFTKETLFENKFMSDPKNIKQFNK